jgi:hypothetical protein
MRTYFEKTQFFSLYLYYYYIKSSTHSLISFGLVTIDCGLLVAIYIKTYLKARAHSYPLQMESPPNVGAKIDTFAM